MIDFHHEIIIFLLRHDFFLLGIASAFFAGCGSGSSGGLFPSSRLVGNLQAGKAQTVVAFGTSLSSNIFSSWFRQLDEDLERLYPGQATLLDRAFGGATSDWGVEHLDALLLNEAPDTVFIEFGINDAKLVNMVSLGQAEWNLLNMLDRIQAALPNCEIILMTMNPPRGPNLAGRRDYGAYYQMYRDVAERRRLKLIDHEPNWDELLATDPALFNQYIADTIHPTEEGSLAIITPEMNQQLGLEPMLPELFLRAVRFMNR